MSLIKYNGKNCYSVGEKLRIFPGINELEKGVLDSLLDHPIVKLKFDAREMEIIETDASEEKKMKETKRSIGDMLKLIPEIFDIVLLQKIVDTDGRAKVVEAAKKMIENLSYKAEDKEKAAEKNDSFKS